MYMHAGSGNHGCEAIVTALRDLIDEDKKLVIVSNNIEEDKQYSLSKSVEDGNCELLQEKHIDKDFSMLLKCILNFCYERDCRVGI